MHYKNKDDVLMLWGRNNEIPYKSGIEEKILGPFSFSKLAWLIPGVIVSVQMSKIAPKIPFVNHLLFERIHLLIPIGIAAVFAYFKDRRTNLTLYQLLKIKRDIKKRRRCFVYHRKNMPRS
ncbi:hypothetical protein [Calidifontibacillus erzurumensis]|uniref:hypothetical protein n=1 Tax=Calidifontibacillus erzurumensis TaxID=2741433 RepID=UPI0035B5270D